MSRSKKEGGAAGMGAVSIFCILLVCCLSAFAVLALVSANADARLSEKNAALVLAYYSADSVAETLLADLTAAWSDVQEPDAERLLQVLRQDRVSAAGVTEESGALRVTYSVAMDEEAIMRLVVEVLLHPPGSRQRVERLQWVLETDESGDVYDNKLYVWRPPAAAE